MTLQDKKKALNKRVKTPKMGVEYTFVFPGRKCYTYTYYMTNDKGRFVFYNKTCKSFTNMTPGWFAKLCRSQLISEVVVEKQEIKAEPQKPTAETYEERTLKTLRSLPQRLEIEVTAAIGYSPAKLASELENLFKDKENTYSQPYVNRVFENLLKAQDIYSTKANNL